MISYYAKCMRCTNDYPKRNIIRRIVSYNKLKLIQSKYNFKICNL
jgi:hypothetical protein